MAPPARTYDSFRRALAGRALPLAWVDLDAFDRNAETMAQRARPLAIRLASKSLRCLQLMRRVLERQPTFRGVLGYSALEATWLADEGRASWIAIALTGAARGPARITVSARRGSTPYPRRDLDRFAAVARAVGLRGEVTSSGENVRVEFRHDR